ncbi:MAG: hypothetical protein JNJ54_34925 [Myxococcaceae bacterium]|nr:hypothetical protein [Myxococcaceae bacterium]
MSRSLTKLTTLKAKAETRTLSVGPLRSTPVGKYTQDQLESARQLVAVELKRLEHSADSEALSRLEQDLQAVEEELDRRSVNLGAA